MDCKNFNIWLNTTEANELVAIPETFRHHVDTCMPCQEELEKARLLCQAVDSEKNASLNSFEINRLVDILENASSKKLTNRDAVLIISKIAAVFVIALGLAIGVITGTYLNYAESDESDWSEEFTLLSDNSEVDSYLFN